EPPREMEDGHIRLRFRQLLEHEEGIVRGAVEDINYVKPIAGSEAVQDGEKRGVEGREALFFTVSRHHYINRLHCRDLVRSSHSTVSRIPSSKGTTGAHPNSRLALEISATTSRTSPGRSFPSDRTVLRIPVRRLMVSIRSQMLSDLPAPALNVPWW